MKEIKNSSKDPSIIEIITFSFVLSIIHFIFVFIVYKIIFNTMPQTSPGIGEALILIIFIPISLILLVNFAVRMSLKTDNKKREWKVFLISLFWCILFFLTYGSVAIKILN